MGGLPHLHKNMPCYYPLNAYRSKKNDGTIVFNTKHGHYGSIFQIACGQCWGCRLERSRIWAIRCMHESQSHKHNQYVTLTYEKTPNNNSLHKPDLVNFWKRLRSRGHKFKYYACGEYGDSTHRPHYHAIIFGLNITDKTFYRSSNGNTLYNSASLQRVWTHGNVIIGNVTFESCAYVSRYIMKKTLGKNAKNDYQIIDTQTGEIIGNITPEFTTMSKGIGKEWFNKYKSDVYQEGTDGTTIIRNGIQTKSPLYYDELFKKESVQNEEKLQVIKKRRQQKVNKKENTRERLIVKEKLAKIIIRQKLPRNLE